VTDGVLIRAAAPADRDRVAALLAASYGELLAGSYPPELLRAAMPALTLPNDHLLASGRFFFAIDEDRLVGCGGWSFVLPGQDGDDLAATGSVAHLRHFAVHPAAARRGIGHRLLARSRAEARVAGARELEALAPRNAVSFYARAGMVEQARVDVPIGGVKFPAVVMRGPS
jgi:GNAT superfamily N-acetyltransferase